MTINKPYWHVKDNTIGSILKYNLGLLSLLLLLLFLFVFCYCYVLLRSRGISWSRGLRVELSLGVVAYLVKWVISAFLFYFLSCLDASFSTASFDLSLAHSSFLPSFIHSSIPHSFAHSFSPPFIYPFHLPILHPSISPSFLTSFTY